MYQLLVVDDEQYALEGIMKTIDWDSIGITNVYGAECAQDAKDIVLNHMPEVIVCDIEMTEESGIDFLRWLHDGGFSAKLIPAGNEPGSRACADICRMPRGSDTPSACCGVFDSVQR